MAYTDARGRTYKAALSRYDLKRDPADHVLDSVLPEDPGPVHAIASVTSSKMRFGGEPHFPKPFEEAWCRASAKVIFAADFDPGDPDACQTCAAGIAQGLPRPGRATSME